MAAIGLYQYSCVAELARQEIVQARKEIERREKRQIALASQARELQRSVKDLSKMQRPLGPGIYCSELLSYLSLPREKSSPSINGQLKPIHSDEYTNWKA
jgi:hypothetical protein